MKRIQILLILAITQLFSVSECRASGSDTSMVLEKLFSRLIASRDDADRIRINDSIKFIIDGYSESDTAFTHRFDNLKFLGQITSKDSRLKIITWNLILKDSPGRYYCYFINKTGKQSRVFRLEGRYTEAPVKSDVIYNEKDWYGALYYDLRRYGKGSENYWVLLGIDFGNPSITRKIIDVVSFTPEGRIIFGRRIFGQGNTAKFREVLEYSSEAVVSLKFVSDKSIVFDHLVPLSPSLKDNKQYYGPDFSYDAYNLEKGAWIFRSNVDIRNRKK
jgi:hypothetical protein